MMHDGDYQKALDGFRSDFTFGLQAAGTHWVDSICYLTMAGECLNRMGRPAEALDDYNAALKLYLAFPNWMMGIQFPANIARRTTRRPTPWGQSERRTQLGQFPAAMFLIADTVLADPIPPPNGSSRFTAAGQPVLANVQEIARATALALKRRRELLGPVCPYDPLTAAVAALFARRPAGGNPCAGLARCRAGAGVSRQRADHRCDPVAEFRGGDRRRLGSSPHAAGVIAARAIVARSGRL